MADNVAITAGSGTTIATDQLGDGSHAQFMKLMDGTLDSTNKLVVDSSGRGTVTSDTFTTITVTASGLTAATTAYTAGDVLGAEITLTNICKASSRSALIVNASLVDKAAIVGAVDAFIFDSASTPAADNAANSWSDANMLKLLGVINFDAPITSALNKTSQASNVNMIVTPASGQSCFMVLVTRTGHTFFGAATDLQVRLGVVQN